jgi:hypothetical protein
MNSKININPDSRKQESRGSLARTEQSRSVALRPYAPLFNNWLRKDRQDIWFRKSEMPPGDKKAKQENTYTIKKLNNKPMDSRLRIIRWLSLLLLSAGLVSWSQRIAQKEGWRQQYLRHKHPKIASLKNFKQIIQTYLRTMENQLKIMRWLSLLMLSEGLRWELQNLAHFSWFRRS